MEQPQTYFSLDGSTWLATILDEVNPSNDAVSNAEFTWILTTETEINADTLRGTCHFCSRKFSSAQALENHLYKHKSRKIYKCKDCLSTLFSRHRFELHQIIFHFDRNRSMKCDICFSLFLNAKQFRNHLKSHPYNLYLKLGTTRKDFYKSAIRTRNEPAKPLSKLCDINAYFSRAKKLQKAYTMKMYKRLRYKLKSAARLRRLKQHSFWENAVIRCHKCHADFDRKYLFRKHMEDIHDINIHDENNDFWCSSCNKSFHNNNRLRLHKKFHTKRKQFECFTCCKKFSLEGRFSLHQKSHLGTSDISISPIIAASDDSVVNNFEVCDAGTDNSIQIEEVDLERRGSIAEDFDECEIDVRISNSEDELDSKSKCESIHPSECTTLSGTDEELGKSLSDFEDEDVEMDIKTLSPNLGDQSSSTFPDVQGDLDLQELTSAWRMLNSRNICSATDSSPVANMPTTDKFYDTQEFTQEDIDAVLTTNERSHSSITPFFHDENDMSDLPFHDFQEHDDESSKRLLSVNPHSIIPDSNINAPISGIRDGDGPGGQIELDLNNKISLQSIDEVGTRVLSHSAVAIPSFRCGTCEKTFKTKTALSVHEKRHDEGPVKISIPEKKKLERKGPHWYTVASLSEKKLASSEDHPKPAITMKLDQLPTPNVLQDTQMSCSYVFCGKDSDGSDLNCYKCSRQFRSQRNFWAHQASHYGDKPFHCNLCPGSVRFRNLKSFREHIDEDHTDKIESAIKFKCPSCSEYSTTFENTFAPIVDARQRAARKDGPSVKFRCQFALCGRPTEGSIQLDYDCFQCDGSFDSLEYLELHKELHVGSTPFPCNICRMCFETIGNLQDHINQKHDDVVPSWEMFTCATCRNSYQGRAPHRKHLRTYSGRATKSKSSDSTALHAPVVPESILTTPNTKGKSIELKKAAPRTKESPKPLIRLDEIMDVVGIIDDHGEGLGSNTAESSDPLRGDGLQNEKRKVVANSLKCPECGKQHNGVRDLQRHLKTHVKIINVSEESKERQVKSNQQSRVACELCSSDFKTISGLKKHYSNHHPGSLVYSCYKCMKVFGDKSTLTRHKEEVHFLKP